jgi:ParB family chromosome partitioning protein
MPLDELHPPEFHPFQVNDDLSMSRLSENIKQYGVLIPGIVRPRSDGAGTSCAGYELVCGNRRKRACELAKIRAMPVIVRELSDADAVLVMVDSNLDQRDKLLPSERAQAYRMMMDALDHNGVKGGSHTYEIMFERTGIKKSQLFRIIRLNDLIAALIDKVDAKQLAFSPAVELSYLTVPEQTCVVEAMAKYQVKPSLSQAMRLKEMSKAGTLTTANIDSISSEAKKPPKGEPTSSMRFRKYFPPDYSPKQMEKVIVGLLRQWQEQHIAEVGC